MTHFIPKALLIKHPFVLFGPTHLMTMAVIAVVIAALVSFVRITNNKKLSFRIACGIGVFSGFSYLLVSYCRFQFLHEPLRQVLPLQICNILSLLLIPWILIKKNQSTFEICYYLGLGGSLQGIITPDLHYSIPFIPSLFYYTEHSAIVLGVIYCLVVYRMRPQKGSVIKTWVTVNLYCFTMMGINYLLATNYVYTWHKPHGTNLFSYLSPWPWYIPEISFIALIIITCLYLPFYLPRLYKNTRLSKLQF
jgi:hypothetical integral membrane protein (TIGR02206 family)